MLSGSRGGIRWIRFKWIGCVVISFWLVMVALLIQKVHFNSIAKTPDTLTSLSPEAVEPQRDWMEIYLKGEKVGYSVYQVMPLELGYLVQEEIFLKFNLLGIPSEIKTSTRSVLDRSLHLRRFRFRTVSGAVTFNAVGRVSEGRLHLKIGRGQNRREKTIALSGPLVVTSALGCFFRGRELSVGQGFEFLLFDPSTLSRKAVRIEVKGKDRLELGGKTHRVFRLETILWGQRLKFWLDESGNILKEEGFMGFTLVKSNPAKAPEDLEKEAGGDIYDLAAVEIEEPLPKPERISYLRLEARGLEDARLDTEVFRQGRQHLHSGKIEIRREALPDRTCSPAASQKALRDWKGFLQAEINIQSGAVPIVKKAREIRGDTADPVKAARQIMDWVYRSLEKRPVLGIPDALTVLENRTGDCNEHAVLLTALLRASGIPARRCAGLVFTRGKFFYHAWNEAYLGKWITMDATLNQMPVDATHLKLTEGGPANQVRMTGLMGKLQLRVLDYGYD